MPSDILHWTPCRGTEAPSEIIALGIYLILKRKRKAVVISFLLLFLTKYFFWLMQLLRFFISL